MTQEEKDLMEIGELLHEAARRIFVYCEAESDFCIQCVQTAVVFGGSNRLLWSPNITVTCGAASVNGFWIDRTYCSRAFAAKFDELVAKTNDTE